MNPIVIRNGHIWTWWSFTANSDPQATPVFKGEVMASGTGVLSGRVATCARAPGDTRPYRDERQCEIGPFNLTEQPTAFPFTIKLNAHEHMGYLSLKAAEATVYYVSGALAE